MEVGAQRLSRNDPLWGRPGSRKHKGNKGNASNFAIGENRNQYLNLYRTVLEGYWELEARTGTVGKLQVSTFSFSEYFLSKIKISP